MNDVKNWVTKNNKWVAFVISTLICLIIGICSGVREDNYIYDSMEYYFGAKSFVSNGCFSLKNYSITYRGYAFPLIILLYCKIASCLGISDWIAIMVANSIIVSMIFSVFLPSILKIDKKYIISVLTSLGIFCIYWRDLYTYPLTDVYSYFFVLLAIWLLQRIDSREIYNIFRMLIIGISAYLAYNIRPIYEFVFPFLLVGWLIINKKKIREKRWKILIGIIFVCIGILGAAWPQSKVNQVQHNSHSIKVITEDLGGGNLFYSQLYMGLFYDRYDTFVGDINMYPVPQMNYIDKGGLQIIANEQIDEIDSIASYIRLVLKYPLDYLGIMTRHMANVFYLPYGHIYISNTGEYKYVYALLNWTILFICGIFFSYSKKRPMICKDNCLILISLIPCVAILPGAIESRFFVPLYCLIYFFFSQIDWKELIQIVKERKIKMVFTYIFYLAIMCGICGATMASAQNIPQLLK